MKERKENFESDNVLDLLCDNNCDKRSHIKRFQAISPPENSPRKVPPRYIPPRNVPPRKNRMFFWFLAALFRFVARFARVRIEDSSFNRFASTAYFAKPGFVGVEFSGGKQPGWNLPGGIFRGGICLEPIFFLIQVYILVLCFLF